MSVIDQRIVEMVFNNQQFEKGVDTTMQSIDKLDKSLAFEGVGNGLAHISDSVDVVASRFDGWGIAAMTVIQRVTNKVLDLGEHLVKSLTIDQLTDGFKKYESSVSNIKAIMNQSGKDIQTVNGYIDQLAWYSDQTSFSFDSMTSALKSFTQQGIDLDQAIPMIMGIGNAVTYTGVGAKEGSAAFQYYAKAISAGYMTNKEWISISRTLGAASVGLKQQFMDAAAAAGTLKKKADGAYYTSNGLKVTLETFDSTLGNQKGKWLTTAVMMDVLKGQYGDVSLQLKDLMDQHKRETGELLTLQEATEMFADQLDATAVKYALSATEAKTFTEAIDATKDAVSTQFKTIFDSVFGNTEEAIKLWSDLNGYLVDTFATPFANAAKLASEWKRIGGREDLINSFWNITEALGKVGEAIKTAWRSVFPAKNAGSIKRFTERIEQFTEKIKNNEQFIERFKAILIGVFSAFNLGKKYIKAFFAGLTPLVDKFREIFGSLKDKIYEVVGGKADSLFGKSVASIGDHFTEITDKVTAFSDRIVSFFDKLGFMYKIAGGGIGGVINAIGFAFQKFITSILSGIQKLTGWDLTGVISTVSDALSRFRDRVVNFVKGIQNSGFGQAIKDFFGSFGNKTDDGNLEEKVSLLERLRNAFEKIRTFLAPLTATIKEFFTTTWAKIKEGFSNLTFDDAMGALGGAAVGAGAFSIFTLIENIKKKFKDFGSLDKIADSISDFVSKLKDSIGLFKGGDTFADTLKKVATSILILAAALFIMASIDAGQMWNAIGGVAALFTEIALFSEVVGGVAEKNFNKVSTGLVKISAAVLLMSIGVKILAGIKANEMKQGLSAMAIVLGELAAFTLITGGKGKNKLGDIGKNMIYIAASMLIFAISLKKLGSIDADVMAQGLKAMAIVLGELAIAMDVMPENMTGSAVGLVVTGVAILILAKALNKLGSIDARVMKQGLSSMAIALGELALAMFAMKETLGASAAILVAVIALNLLVPVIKQLGNMDIEKIGIALLALAGTFAVLALGAFLVEECITTLVLLGATIALMGVGIAALAVGILLLSANIGVIAAAIPMVLTAIVAGIGLFIKALANMAGNIIEAVVIIVTAILDGLIALLPKFGEFVVAVVETVCETISGCIDSIVDCVLDVLVAVINGLAEHAGDILEAVGNLITKVLEFLAEKLPIWKEKGAEILTTLKEGIQEKIKDVTDKIKELAESIIKKITDKVGDFKQAGKDAIDGFIKGIKAKISEAVEWAEDLGGKVLGGLKKVLGIHSPSKAFAEIGKYSVQGLSVGLEKYSHIAEDSAVGIGEDVTDALADSFSHVADAINGDVDFDPTIKPVLDLTNVQNGAKYLDTAFGGRSINADIRGRLSDFESQQALALQFSQLRNDIYDALSGIELSPDSLGSAVRSALEGTGVYMNRDRVGKLVTDYQNNTRRASGAY